MRSDEERKAKALSEARALRAKADDYARTPLESVGLSLKSLSGKNKRKGVHGPLYKGGRLYQQPSDQKLVWKANGQKSNWLRELEAKAGSLLRLPAFELRAELGGDLMAVTERIGGGCRRKSDKGCDGLDRIREWVFLEIAGGPLPITVGERVSVVGKRGHRARVFGSFEYNKVDDGGEPIAHRPLFLEQLDHSGYRLAGVLNKVLHLRGPLGLKLNAWHAASGTEKPIHEILGIYGAQRFLDGVWRWTLSLRAEAETNARRDKNRRSKASRALDH
jgi:hypothetical protein